MGDVSRSSPDRTVAELASLEGDLAQFARVCDVQGAQLAWFVGAGTSAMSDIPTAGALISRFKHELYCAAHGLDVQDVDPADRRTARLIDDHFDGRHGFPPRGDPSEYSVAFERAYASADVRADFIADLCRGRHPNFGHFVMAALMATGRLRAVFTTNFDELVEVGAHSLFEAASVDPRPSLTVADLGDPGKAERALRKESWPLIAKLHGDFRSDRLKNTRAELSAQDEAMRAVLRSACRRFGLVVAGYSGRDESVMAALAECLEDHGSFPAGIYWCFRPIDPPPQAVLDFLVAARNAGKTACAVPVDNFIELAGAVERAVRFPDTIRASLAARRPAAAVTPVPLPTGPTQSYPVLRLNALPILQLPSEVRVLKESSPCELSDAQAAIRSARAKGLVARRSGGALVAVGHLAELAAALTPLGIEVTEEVQPFHWSADEIDPADLGLLVDAVTLGLGRTAGLRHVLARRGHQVRVVDANVEGLRRLASAAKAPLTGTIPDTSLSFAEAVGVNVERRGDAWWLLITPELWVSPRNRAVVDPRKIRQEQALAADFVRERRARRYNRDVNGLLDAWARVLCGGRGPRSVRTWNLREGEGIDPSFEISGVTAFSRPLSETALPGEGSG